MSVQFVVASKLVVSCVFLEPFLLCEGLDDAFFFLSLSLRPLLVCRLVQQ